MESTPIYRDRMPPGPFGVQPCKAMLQERGILFEEAAGALGVTPEFVSMVTSGRSRPSLPVAARLAKLLDRTITDLFTPAMLGTAPPRRRRKAD